MVYCVAYNCAKKYKSNSNVYIRRVSAVKTRPQTTTTPRKLPNKWLKRHTEGGTSLYRLISVTYGKAPCILNEVMR